MMSTPNIGIVVSKHGGPEVLEVKEIEYPSAKAGQVIVKNEFMGLNFIDTYFREGKYAHPLPFVLGKEAAGTVVGIGEGVTRWSQGDRVAYFLNANGAQARFTAVPSDELVLVPEKISLKQAASVMLQGMTVHYLATDSFRISQGNTVLIHAIAGGTGLLLSQVCKFMGATVIGTCSSERKAELAKTIGHADHVIDYSTQDFVAEVKRLTDSKGVDVVYDGVGKATFLKSLDCLKPRGLMVLFGAASGFPDPLDLNVLNAKGSLFVTRPKLNDYVATPEERERRATEVLQWIEDEQVVIGNITEFDITQAADAHRALEGRQTTGKVVLRFSDSSE